MSDWKFDVILAELENHFKSRSLHIGALSGGKKPIPIKYLLRGVLRWLAGGSIHDIIYLCGCRKSCFSKLRWNIIDALIDIYWSKVVKLPEEEDEFMELSKQFEQKTGLKDFFGAVDGLLTHITLPMGTKNARPYFCYKKFYALNLQGVAGPNGEFLYVNIGHAGGTCDGFAFRDCLLWELMERGYSNFENRTFRIFADGAYALREWLITPFDAREVSGNAARDVFNLQLARGRQVIERAFGMLISRWRILVGKLPRLSLNRVVKILKCCVLLHNLCLMDGGSAEIVINKTDAHFNPGCPHRGVVKRWRLHLNRHKETKHTHAYIRKINEKRRNQKGASIREAYVAELLLQGRTRNVERGASRCAASQHGSSI